MTLLSDRTKVHPGMMALLCHQETSLLPSCRRDVSLLVHKGSWSPSHHIMFLFQALERLPASPLSSLIC